MERIARLYWQLVEMKCSKLSSGDDAMYLDASLLDSYIHNCEVEYNRCKETTMNNKVVNLDRHKIAAILVIQAMNMRVIKRVDNRDYAEADTEDKYFIGPQKILVICAIHYLAQEINRILVFHGDNISQMTKFPLPKAFSCDTEYIDIISRLLRNELDENKLFILSLSEKFFLLEYIAIRDFYGDCTKKVYEILRKPIHQ